MFSSEAIERHERPGFRRRTDVCIARSGRVVRLLVPNPGYFRVARDTSAVATANRERQGALTESRTTIAGDPFYREWLCGAGQGCRGRILERLYIDNCLPLTVELFHQLAFFILSCKPISYCRFKRIDVYIL